MIARNEILGSWTLAKIYIKLKSQHRAERTGSNNPSSLVWGQNWFTFPYPQGQDIHGGRWVWKSLTRKSLCPILLIQEERKNFIKQSWAATLPHMGGGMMLSHLASALYPCRNSTYCSFLCVTPLHLPTPHSLAVGNLSRRRNLWPIALALCNGTGSGACVGVGFFFIFRFVETLLLFFSLKWK